MRVDENLSMGERRMRWRIIKAARRERVKGRRVNGEGNDDKKGVIGGGQKMEMG